jgi:hypothetical protein
LSFEKVSCLKYLVVLIFISKLFLCFNSRYNVAVKCATITPGLYPTIFPTCYVNKYLF